MPDTDDLTAPVMCHCSACKSFYDSRSGQCPCQRIAELERQRDELAKALEAARACVAQWRPNTQTPREHRENILAQIDTALAGSRGGNKS